MSHTRVEPGEAVARPASDTPALRDYVVTVSRTSVRNLDLQVRAASVEDAIHRALDAAGDRDFGAATEAHAHYDATGVALPAGGSHG